MKFGHSGCKMCPFRSDEEWLDMKLRHPDDFEEACQYDEAIRHGLPKMRGEGYCYHYPSAELWDAGLFDTEGLVQAFARFEAETLERAAKVAADIAAMDDAALLAELEGLTVPIDIVAIRTGGICCMAAATDEAVEWMEREVGPAHMDGPTWVAEHRFAPDILAGAHNDGLTVSLDGRIVDAEREA